MEIRLARVADADGIWTLLQPVFRAGDTYAIDPEISRDAALAYWMDLPAATYVVTQAGAIVGTYYIKTNQQGGGNHVCNCGYIVGNAARGQGLAAQMCEASQEQALALGYEAMQFNFVLASNAGALRLWHRLGFETVGLIPKAFKHPSLGLVAAHVMFKWLRAT
ncbi:MAG: GNAT family N-acetyltransferase [Loktanella sp.]|jgi:RimJ/RimL family protein N-acetyltransferase|nr:GNAT family N-acetyltransferase [Yoonia sp.]MDO7558697.1 GNAT family N-acetyltransferase [Loktanella sp.]MDO7608773.1 GNAT family N-acetyltransferase [Loktanella sp.]MDO7623204.1 GNAT family N-acetyltransferase [Loktanella sp.]MDO7625625.1 GNAT family N-acetyltransferase [Loktanella sp.]